MKILSLLSRYIRFFFLYPNISADLRRHRTLQKKHCLLDSAGVCMKKLLAS